VPGKGKAKSHMAAPYGVSEFAIVMYELTSTWFQFYMQILLINFLFHYKKFVGI
jgi:hypothetical protein